MNLEISYILMIMKQNSNIYMLNEIIKKLGFKELLTIHNSKRTYKYGDYEIVFETVKNLGYFIEVEYCTNEDVDVIEEKKKFKDLLIV